MFKKLKKLKAVTVLLGVVLVLSMMLSACGKASEQPSETGQQADSEPYEVSMAYFTLTDNPDWGLIQDEINKITKAKINATLKMVPINVSNYANQTNLMLTGNEKMDLVMTSSLIGVGNYLNQAVKGQLLPLDDLLEKYGQGIKDAVGEKYLHAAKINGKVYGVPPVKWYATGFGLAIRKDIVDKYHIDLSQVKTIAGAEPVLKTIKENEPGMAPIVTAEGAAGGVSTSFDHLQDSFGVLRISDNNLKVINLFETKEYADGLDLARKWYKAGYSMKDAATTKELWNVLIKNNKAAGTFSLLHPQARGTLSSFIGKEMVVVSLAQPLSSTSVVTNWMMSIAKNSENPEKAMEMLNLFYTDKDIENLFNIGIEGKHYVKNPNGLIAKPDGTPGTAYYYSQEFVGNNFLSYVLEGDDPNLFDQVREFNESAIKSKALGFSFAVDPVKTEIAAVTNVYNQYRKGLETGTLEPATKLPEFNKKLKEAGIDKIIAEKQKQLDAWAKENNVK